MNDIVSFYETVWYCDESNEIFIVDIRLISPKKFQFIFTLGDFLILGDL